jgi:hypothetical protein
MTGLTVILLSLMSGAAPEVSPDPAQLVISPKDLARARELVLELGSPIFRARDNATRELRSMGRKAIPALKTVINSPDPEVQMRVESLLPRAEEEDLKIRVAVFLADKDGKYEHDLPGWRAFAQIAGSDNGARLLFSEMVRNPDNHQILLATRNTSDPVAAAELGRSILARRKILASRNIVVAFGNGISSRNAPPNLADTASLFFAETQIPESKIPDAMNAMQPVFIYSNALNDATIIDALKPESRYGPAFRRLTAAWFESRESFASLFQAMNSAHVRGFGAETVCRVSQKLIRLTDAMPYYRAQAMNHIARYNGKAYLPSITSVFSEETAITKAGPNNPNPDILLKDTGLAMALLITGQDPLKYGFDTQSNAQHDSLRFTYMHYRFQSSDTKTAEEKRAAAFEQWMNWERSNAGCVVGPASVYGWQSIYYRSKSPNAGPQP